MPIIFDQDSLKFYLGHNQDHWTQKYNNCKIEVTPEFVSVVPFVKNAKGETHTKEDLYFPFTSKQLETLIDIAERTALNYKPLKVQDIDGWWFPTFAPYVYDQPSTPKEDIDAAQDFKVFVTDNRTKIMLSTATNMLDAQRLLKVFVTRYITQIAKPTCYLYGNRNVHDITSLNQFENRSSALKFLKDRLNLELFIENRIGRVFVDKH